LLFDGFLTLYQEGKDDEEDEESRRLPKLENRPERGNRDPRPISISPSRRRVIRKPASSRSSKSSASAAHRPTPPRSRKLRERDYVRMDRNRFFPEDKGRLVTAFLENFSTATWNTISPPTLKPSSTTSPPAR